MLEEYLQLKQNTYEVRFREEDRSYARLTLENLLQAAGSLGEYLGIEKPAGLRAVIAPDRKEYEKLVVKWLGVDIEIPSNPGRIAQPQRKDLVFLSPRAYREQSTFEYHPEEYERLIFHEVTHVLEELLSPGIEFIPRWWSEGLAVYLSGHWRYSDQFNFRQPVVQGIREGKIPTFLEVARRVDLSYEWGWTMVMFIERTRGREVIPTIIRECSDGNILELLKISEEEFSREWQEWLLGAGKEIIIRVEYFD